MIRASSAFVLTMLCACNSTKESVDTGDTGLRDVWQVACPEVDFVPDVRYDMDDIEDCFGNPADPGFEDAIEAALLLYAGDDYIIDASWCVSGSPLCVLQWDGASETVLGQDTCGCRMAMEFELPDPDSCCDYTDPEGDFEARRDQVAEALEDYCAFEESVTLDVTTNGHGPLPDTSGASWEIAEEECDIHVAVNADYVLDIDPSLSYITLDNGSTSVSSAMTGSGTAATGPARFLLAVAWAEDATLGTTDYTDWRFGLDAPMQLDMASGSFTIDASGAPLMYGRGDEDGTDHRAEIGMDDDAAGVIHIPTMTWHLDYTETGMGGQSLTIHLKGAISAL
jgi:hypothetical protein